MRIGHASIDENGRISRGKAGDQTKKEVCIREWYNKPWNVLLRCKDSAIAEKMAQACEKGCNNNNIGYDQNQRNSLRTYAYANNFDLSAITTPCECDCSSFMAICCECSGIKIPYNGNNAPTTSTMRKAFSSTGMFEVLTDSKYLTRTDYLKRGDILIKEGLHTAMVLDNGKLSAATENTKSIDEVAKEVLNGLWGNGTTRKLRLEQAGYNYNEVQAKVNEILKNK